MGKARKARKFAVVKKMISAYDQRIKKDPAKEAEDKKKRDEAAAERRGEPR